MANNTRGDLAGFALGTYALTGGYGAVDAAGLIEAFIDMGGSRIDTAALYGDGQSEELVGAAVRAAGPGARPSLSIASKGGFSTDPATGKRHVNGRPEQITRDCEASLKRLGLEMLDLYYLHRMDPDVPIEETVGAMSQLREAGKVRAIGLCEVGPNVLARACTVTPIDALQAEYSLVTRDPEAMFESLAHHGMQFYAFSPLSRGLLTGALTHQLFEAGDDRAHLPRFNGEAFVHNLDVIEALKELAQDNGMTLAQMALAWCVKKGAIAISGATHPAHLEDLRRASEVSLSADIVNEAQALSASIIGARYSEEGMRRAAIGHA